MSDQQRIDTQKIIKRHLRLRGFRKEAEYFELILAIEDVVTEIVAKKVHL